MVLFCHRMKKFLPFLALSVLALGAGCAAPAQDATPSSTTADASEATTDTSSSMTQWTFPGTLPAEEIAHKQIRMTTEYGDIVFTLFDDTAPMAVSNYVYLAKNGYFNGLTFHRRVEGFVLQGGDPTGTGRGGPGYEFPDELNDGRVYDKGIVAMANKGADTNGSQFFIMLADVPIGQIDKAYTIFGKVTEGMDIVEKLQMGEKMLTVTVEEQAE